MSGKKRPRGRCPRCRKLVAVHPDGKLWWHYLPGWGLWSDGGDCPGSRGKPEP